MKRGLDAGSAWRTRSTGALQRCGGSRRSWRSRPSRLGTAPLRRSRSEAARGKATDTALTDPTLSAMASALEARDPYTGNHSERVSEYATVIARRMDLTAEQVAQVRAAAVLHDIGKIGIPDSLLHKPGPLTALEYGRVMEHPMIGEQILRHLLNEDHPIVQAVRSHHEWVDGSGQPDGLAGEEIPLTARILAVADAFDAMTSARPYRSPLPLDVALAELEKNAGSQFDARCVEALCESFADSAVTAALAAMPA